MSRDVEQLKLIWKLYINNGEYEFSNKNKADKFAIDLYWEIHRLYSSEGYYNQFDKIEDFIYSHHVDNAAYWLYEEGGVL